MRMFLSIVLAVLGLTLSINAQSGTLSGLVTDQLGAVIPGAEIELADENNKLFRSTTNEQGLYKIDLPAGTYRFAVLRPPFTKFLIAEYFVPQHASLKLDVALRCIECQIIEDLVPEPSPIETKNIKIDESLKTSARPLLNENTKTTKRKKKLN